MNNIIQKNMTCLVVGFGSIGQRHARLLSSKFSHVSVVSKRKILGYQCFHDIGSAFSNNSFDYVIISNSTIEHYDTFQTLINYNFNGSVLVEKPLFEKVRSLKADLPFTGYVAYNLRFHPIIQQIYHHFNKQKVFSMHVYCGHDLSLWRKTDYTKSYSASEAQGGGVLRDLSHELDYINWMTGGWENIVATGGKVSDLIIDSDDLFCVLLQTRKCPVVSLQINYFDLEPRREIILNGQDLSLKADLIKGDLTINGKTIHYKLDKNDTYSDQHKAVLKNDRKYLCDLDTGFQVLKLLDSIKESSIKKRWIANI
ncbi:Gfo/Idh/MocA family oxidoreductase [Desulfobacterales bacterium HSG17]|nr:Gfo/Idh/MocA family oxidoreductase [Desulfobacterales bacterium HSG17]